MSASANGRAPRQRVGPRAKIAVLLPSGWLYGTVNRAEFDRAVSDPKKHRTFRLSKRGWHGNTSVVDVISSHVDAVDWQAPATPVRRKKAAKLRVTKPLTQKQAVDLSTNIEFLDENALAMLCLAAGVDSIEALSQATLPAFREALAGYMDEARA